MAYQDRGARDVKTTCGLSPIKLIRRHQLSELGARDTCSRLVPPDLFAQFVRPRLPEQRRVPDSHLNETAFHCIYCLTAIARCQHHI